MLTFLESTKLVDHRVASTESGNQTLVRSRTWRCKSRFTGKIPLPSYNLYEIIHKSRKSELASKWKKKTNSPCTDGGIFPAGRQPETGPLDPHAALPDPDERSTWVPPPKWQNLKASVSYRFKARSDICVNIDVIQLTRVTFQMSKSRLGPNVSSACFVVEICY